MDGLLYSLLVYVFVGALWMLAIVGLMRITRSLRAVLPAAPAMKPRAMKPRRIPTKLALNPA